jgi:hypothetical protein
MRRLFKFCFIYSVFFSQFTLIEAATETIGVFCSADDKVSLSFKKMTFELGQSIAQKGYGLVTGGSCTGLMKEVVDGYQGENHPASHVQGVLPHALRGLPILHPGIGAKNFTWTETLHQRLATFQDKCDVILVLPGGFGTLHELMDFLVHTQFGLLKKKIILFNMENFWDPLLRQFQEMVKKNTVTKKHLDQLEVISSLEQLWEKIEATQNLHEGLEDSYWENKGEEASTILESLWLPKV